MYTVDDKVEFLKGIGGKTAETFAKAGIEKIEDLLMYLPYRYDRYDIPVDISDEYVGRVVAVRATIASAPIARRTGRLSHTVCKLSNNGNLINVIWFNMPYIKNQLHKGETMVFRGRLTKSNYGYSFEQPSVHKEDNYMNLTGNLQPVYKLTTGLTHTRIRGAVKDAFDNLIPAPEYLPIDIVRRYNLMDRYEALRIMHFPKCEEELIEARRRIVFDEFLEFILAIRSLREEDISKPNHFNYKNHSVSDKLLNSLPYELTGAQQKVLGQIRADLTGDKLMNRLVQGDVGSGKTILALLALIDTAENGYQGALMAPTEVLARQHFENFKHLFEEYNIPYKVELLTGSMSAAEKRAAYARIKNKESDIIVGTHALIQKGVEYNNLALVVTDEQHRFGVKQREMLSEKADAPHVIVMSATPIPRTLAIILYGELDISTLDEKPAKRLPIKNCVVGKSYRAKAYEFIRNQIREGRQAYVVCSQITADDDIEAENVIDYTEKLRSVLPPAVRVEYLHGKMKASEKNAIMESFLAGEIDVLCSTTVIEVGVDVANATVMMIEDAERFGLATLHQLRGRVGRGEHQSYCIFINASGDAAKQERLEILNNSNDGFKIAEEDLKLRGPGDLFGIEQSGAINFVIGDIYNDSNILKIAAEVAKTLENKGKNNSEKNLKKYLTLTL